ncbi:MAG TPA: acetyl-CoA carboxylase biotin carboxyl carrier protein [Parafilimonas sp.]|nr:acetyl-CoA carboxylase biotin carboxyl carrier protein [Parafilimonas sp.]
MDYKQIQELIKLINKSNIGELSIEEKDFKILIKQKKDRDQQTSFIAPPSIQQPVFVQPVHETAAVQLQSTAQMPAEPAAKTDNLITIKSPMIGTFYKRPSPDKPNFVEVGDEITPGKVVCIIEAMKLFNEIESEVSGKVVKVLLDDASPVEYDQPLFLVEPS